VGTPPSTSVSGSEYRRWLSKNTTGSVPCNAKFNMPLASYAVAGNMTFSPGMCATIEVQSCECCAPYLEPTDTRSTSGISSTPADIACHLDIWLKISSPARPMKSQYISSDTTRPPLSAYPTPAPTIAPSEIEVLNRRWYGSASVSPR